MPTDSVISLCGKQNKEINIAETALNIVSDMHEGISIDRYINHFTVLGKDTKKRFQELIEEGALEDARTRLASLKHVICELNSYTAASEQANPLEVYDVMRVVDLGVGARSTLSLIYINTAQLIGWDIEALNFPGGLLCRIKYENQYLIFDPADKGGQLMEAHDLRQRVKDVNGNHAELSSEYYEAISPIDILIHVHNPIKLKFIEMGDYEAALDIVGKLKLIKPEEYRLYLDAGVLYARLGQTDHAVDALNAYIKNTPNQADKTEAQTLLDDLQD